VWQILAREVSLEHSSHGPDETWCPASNDPSPQWRTGRRSGATVVRNSATRGNSTVPHPALRLPAAIEYACSSKGTAERRRTSRQNGHRPMTTKFFVRPIEKSPSPVSFPQIALVSLACYSSDNFRLCPWVDPPCLPHPIRRKV